MLGVLAVVGLPILLLVAAILTPAVLGGLARAQRTEMIANGRAIGQAAVVADMEGLLPLPADEATSAAYLTALVAEGRLNVGRGFFSGPRMPSGKGPVSRADPLRSEENAWRVVVGIKPDHPATTPFLVTRNFVPSTLGERPRLSDQSPFGREGVVVVAVGGSAMFLSADQLDEEWSALVPEELGDRRILPP